MAARRLIALLVVLLVISSIAAALAPTPAEREGEPSPTGTTTAPAGPAADGGGEARLLEVTVDAPPTRSAPDASKDAPASRARPVSIDAAVGDQLALTVRSPQTVAIEIPELGLLETASPGGPARFDLLLREAGRLGVRAESGGQVAWIVVAPPAAPDKGAMRRKSTKPSASQPT